VKKDAVVKFVDNMRIGTFQTSSVTTGNFVHAAQGYQDGKEVMKTRKALS